MLPVGVDIEGVVEEVGAARREAQRDERDRGAEDLVRVGEDPGGAGGRDDQQVLQPLLRSCRPQQRDATATGS
jgi:hypothetical protein